MPNSTDRAAFYLCLARAFLPPRGPEAFDGLTRYLPDDLETLNRDLGYPVHSALLQLRECLAAVTDHAALLLGYSALFLAPPAPASLNAGLYLDGAVAGETVGTVREWYRRFGLSRAEDFRDLDDHVALQLEFLALLFAQNGDAADAGGTSPAHAFLASMVQHWVTPFRDAVRAAASTDNPAVAAYAALADLLAQAVAHEITELRAEPDTATPAL